MPLKQLNFDNLGDLDNGTARQIADHEIRRAVQDLEDRASQDGKAREVHFKLELYLYEGKVNAHLHAQAKLPPRRTNATATMPKERDGETFLAFRDDNAENAEQQTFNDVK